MADGHRRARRHIVLIGPVGVGKTPVAEIISAKTGIEHVLLDLADEDRHRLGWSMEESWAAKEAGILEQLRYEAKFTIPLIERVVAQHADAVIDCGGTDLVGFTDSERAMTGAALRSLGLRHVAALLPFEAEDETRSFLRTRGPLSALEELLITNAAYAETANRVFYTRGGPLERIADAIIAWAIGEA